MWVLILFGRLAAKYDFLASMAGCTLVLREVDLILSCTVSEIRLKSPFFCIACNSNFDRKREWRNIFCPAPDDSSAAVKCNVQRKSIWFCSIFCREQVGNGPLWACQPITQYCRVHFKVWLTACNYASSTKLLTCHLKVKSCAKCCFNKSML